MNNGTGRLKNNKFTTMMEAVGSSKKSVTSTSQNMNCIGALPEAYY
jgi:hypothetical protein